MDWLFSVENLAKLQQKILIKITNEKYIDPNIFYDETEMWNDICLHVDDFRNDYIDFVTIYQNFTFKNFLIIWTSEMIQKIKQKTFNSIYIVDDFKDFEDCYKLLSDNTYFCHFVIQKYINGSLQDKINIKKMLIEKNPFKEQDEKDFPKHKKFINH